MKKSLFLMGLFALLISCKGNVSKIFLKPISLNR